MTDSEHIDPADQLRADIEAAIEGQQPKEPEPEPEPADKEPLDEPTSSEDSRDRDEKGRFVAKTDRDAAIEEPEKAEDTKVEPEPVEGAKTDIRPPPGFSVATKAAWDKEAPTAIEWAAAKADIAKREIEVDNGFKRYSGLGRFAEEAERNGTTLQAAVTDYVAVETALKQNPIGGVEYICQRMGWDPRQLVQAMAARYGAQVVDPRASHQPDTQISVDDAIRKAVAPPAPQSIDPAAIAAHVAQVVRAEAEQREINSKLDAFKADPKNRFFDNLRLDMAKIVQAGKAETIEQAYEAACWLNPEIRTILINEANGGKTKDAAAAASKSRNAAKAVGGAPAPGVATDAPDKRKNLSLDEEIRAAIDAQVGAA